MGISLTAFCVAATAFVDKAKDVTVQAAGKVAEVTTNAVAATQKAVSETAQKINDSLAHLQQRPGGIVDTMSQRAKFSRFRVIKGHRADAGSTLFQIYAQSRAVLRDLGCQG